jgi:glucosamine-6-phosphate deaminase
MFLRVADSQKRFPESLPSGWWGATVQSVRIAGVNRGGGLFSGPLLAPWRQIERGELSVKFASGIPSSSGSRHRELFRIFATDLSQFIEEGSDDMQLIRCNDPQDLGQRAASAGAECIRQALQARGTANIIVATGASQFATLSALVAAPGIDWGKVTAFHLDEYIGLSAEHPASFRKYLKERFVDLVPLRKFHYVDGSAPDARVECQRLGDLISRETIDVAFIGIGENGHLAFNDPPADFETETPYLVVNLDEGCRRQQWGEGWFPTLEDVPRTAISMSVRQIMKCKHLICSVPDERKAEAVRGSLEGPVTPQVPASILQQHEHCLLFVDPPAASLLSHS